MGHKVGDAVRMRDGSDLRELLEPWDEATGEIIALHDDADGPRISIRFGDPGPVGLALPAQEFVPDRALTAAPF